MSAFRTALAIPPCTTFRGSAGDGADGERIERLAALARRDPPEGVIVLAEVAGEITPRNAGASEVEESFEEHAVRKLGRSAALIFLRLLDEGFEKDPEIVGDHKPHGILPRGTSEKLPKVIDGKGMDR